MIERSSQAFNQGADYLENLKRLQARRSMDRELHVSNMVNMERQIDANYVMNLFLGGKGNKRAMAPLEFREVRRRDNFKDEYTSRLNLYHGIIENIKKFTGMPDIKIAMDHYSREENDGFQYYRYLNELNNKIDYMLNDFFKVSADIKTSDDYNTRKMKYYDQRIGDLHKVLHVEIDKTFKLQDDREKYEFTIEKYLDTIFEIMKIVNCEMSIIKKHLGNYEKVTVFNFQEFMSLLEQRLNQVLAVVYCDQRKNLDLLTDDGKLIVKSMKRQKEVPLRIESIITTTQCAECAERADVNRYDETIVYPLDREAVRARMQAMVNEAQITFRLHNLSKCNLPRSGFIAGRRYAEWIYFYKKIHQ